MGLQAANIRPRAYSTATVSQSDININAMSDFGLNFQVTTDELMVEWSKCRARAIHWVEEVRLLDVEMQRVLDFNESMARIWDNRAVPEATIVLGEEDATWGQDDTWADGVRVYALKQAHIRRAQATQWREQFADYKKDTQRFLAVHTTDGLSIEPLEMLSPEEAHGMIFRAGRRKAKFEKAKLAKARRLNPSVEVPGEAAEAEAGDPDAMVISAPAPRACRTKGKKGKAAGAEGSASQSTEQGTTARPQKETKAVEGKHKGKQ